MAESLREAVEGFERDRAGCAHPGLMLDRVIRVDYTPSDGTPWTITREGVCGACGARRRETTHSHVRAELTHGGEEARPRLRLRRQDVHTCITAANDARQLAIASPKLAEQALRQATRLSDLAERIAMLLEGGE